MGVPCKLNNSSSRVVSQTSYKRRQQTSSSDVPTTSSGVHDSTSSRRLNMTSLGPLHDVLTTSSRRRISCRVTVDNVINSVIMLIHTDMKQ